MGKKVSAGVRKAGGLGGLCVPEGPALSILSSWCRTAKTIAHAVCLRVVQCFTNQGITFSNQLFFLESQPLTRGGGSLQQGLYLFRAGILNSRSCFFFAIFRDFLCCVMQQKICPVCPRVQVSTFFHCKWCRLIILHPFWVLARMNTHTKSNTRNARQCMVNTVTQKLCPTHKLVPYNPISWHQTEGILPSVFGHFAATHPRGGGGCLCHNNTYKYMHAYI